MKKRPAKLILKNEIFMKDNFFEVCNKIFQSENLSAKEAYRINKLIKELNKQHQNFLEIKDKLINKFGTIDDKVPNQYVFKGDKRKKFELQFQELLQEEFVIIDINKLPYPESVKIKPADFSAIDEIFDFTNLER